MAHTKRVSPQELATLAEADIDYSTDTVNLFTWNPSPKFYGNTYNREEFRQKWDKMLCKVIRWFPRCMSKYCVIPEVSDAGRLHCHGWFVLKDKVKWNLSVRKILAHNGYIKVNKLRHVNGLSYYKKDMNSLGTYFPNRETVITHRNLKQAFKDVKVSLRLCASAAEPQRARVGMLKYMDVLPGEFD